MLVKELRSHIPRSAAKKKKSFTNKQKVREFSTTQPGLQKLLKNFSRLKTQGRIGTTKTDPKKLRKW